MSRGLGKVVVRIGPGGELFAVTVAVAIGIRTSVGIETLGHFDKIRDAVAITVLERRRATKLIRCVLDRTGDATRVDRVVVETGGRVDPRAGAGRGRVERTAARFAEMDRRARVQAGEGELDRVVVGAGAGRDRDIVHRDAEPGLEGEDRELRILLVHEGSARSVGGVAEILGGGSADALGRTSVGSNVPEDRKRTRAGDRGRRAPVTGAIGAAELDVVRAEDRLVEQQHVGEGLETGDGREWREGARRPTGGCGCDPLGPRGTEVAGLARENHEAIRIADRDQTKGQLTGRKARHRNGRAKRGAIERNRLDDTVLQPRHELGAKGRVNDSDDLRDRRGKRVDDRRTCRPTWTGGCDGAGFESGVSGTEEDEVMRGAREVSKQPARALWQSGNSKIERAGGSAGKTPCPEFHRAAGALHVGEKGGRSRLWHESVAGSHFPIRDVLHLKQRSSRRVVPQLPKLRAKCGIGHAGDGQVIVRSRTCAASDVHRRQDSGFDADEINSLRLDIPRPAGSDEVDRVRRGSRDGEAGVRASKQADRHTRDTAGARGLGRAEDKGAACVLIAEAENAGGLVDDEQVEATVAIEIG